MHMSIYFPPWWGGLAKTSHHTDCNCWKQSPHASFLMRSVMMGYKIKSETAGTVLTRSYRSGRVMKSKARLQAQCWPRVTGQGTVLTRSYRSGWVMKSKARLQAQCWPRITGQGTVLTQSHRSGQVMKSKARLHAQCWPRVPGQGTVLTRSYRSGQVMRQKVRLECIYRSMLQSTKWPCNHKGQGKYINWMRTGTVVYFIPPPPPHSSKHNRKTFDRFPFVEREEKGLLGKDHRTSQSCDLPWPSSIRMTPGHDT